MVDNMSIMAPILIIGPIIIGFCLFLLHEIYKKVKSVGKWIMDFIREVRNKPKYRRKDPYVCTKYIIEK